MLYSEAISLFMFFLFLSPMFNDLFFENKKINLYLIYSANLQRIVLYKNLTIVLIALAIFILTDILLIFINIYPTNLIVNYSQFLQSLALYILLIQYVYLINKNNALNFFQLFSPPLSAFIPLVFSNIAFSFFNVIVNILIFLLIVIGWYFLFIPHFSKSLYKGNLKCIR